MKKLISEKKWNEKIIFFQNFDFFCENHPFTCHIKYNVIDFAPSEK